MSRDRSRPGKGGDEPAGPSDDFSQAVDDVAPLADRGKHLATPARRARRRSAPHRELPPDPFVHPEPGEPRFAHRHSATPHGIERLRRGSIEPDHRIDLHGLRAAVARPALERAVASAARSGTSALLVIHGRGRHSGGVAVLRDAVPEWLEADPRVLAYAPAPAALGGAGATLVLVRSR
jgi:DNA-nicking Smr family endonuclease